MQTYSTKLPSSTGRLVGGGWTDRELAGWLGPKTNCLVDEGEASIAFTFTQFNGG